MNLGELLKQLESSKYRIKQIQFQIKELKETYLLGHGITGSGHSNSGTSPQEVIVTRIDSLERELSILQLKVIEINDEIYKIIDGIKDQKARWIVTQKIKGKAWNEIECMGYSTSYMKHLYKEALRSLK